jgi:hypothetical protein
VKKDVFAAKRVVAVLSCQARSSATGSVLIGRHHRQLAHAPTVIGRTPISKDSSVRQK